MEHHIELDTHVRTPYAVESGLRTNHSLPPDRGTSGQDTHVHDLPVPTGPRIPRTLEWLDLPDDYEGFRFRVWVTYPGKLNTELRSGDQDRMRAALGLIVVEHNGWLDQDGNLLPGASDPAFWDALPDELAAAMIVLVTERTSRLPNSMRRRSPS
jgi:hypothetical protein